MVDDLNAKAESKKEEQLMVGNKCRLYPVGRCHRGHEGYADVVGGN